MFADVKSHDLGAENMAEDAVIKFFQSFLTIAFSALSSNARVSIRAVLAFSMSTAFVPFSLSSNSSIWILQWSTVRPYRPILSLIESKKLVEALLPSKRTLL